jgi:hypothetical protein
LQQLPFYCPTFNSVRRLAACEKLQEQLKNTFTNDSVALNFLSTDTNLYLAFAHVLSLTDPDSALSISAEPTPDIKLPSTPREAFTHLAELE